MKINQFLFAAGISLAMAFTFSCSSDDGDKSDGEVSSSSDVVGSSSSSGGVSSSSSGEASSSSSSEISSSSSSEASSSSSSEASSSSSSEISSSSSSEISYSSSSEISSSSSSEISYSYGSLIYEGKEYRTIVIDNQTWLADNLDHSVEGSKCYDDDPANCVKYGSLYNWATAMALPANCNSTACSSQIQSPHKGICPDGWHIPSTADWEALRDVAGGGLTTAAGHLKAKEGWNENGNGKDTYGFAALPGGNFNTFYQDFRKIGDEGYWWVTSELGGGSAYQWHFGYDSAGWGNDGKTNMFSVRCVKD
jgi:uncharacterized protein (TIGR02145 family)